MTLLGGEDLTEDIFKIIDAEDNVWVGNLSYFTLRVHSTCVVGGWRVWVHMCVGMATKGRAYLLSMGKGYTFYEFEREREIQSTYNH